MSTNPTVPSRAKSRLWSPDETPSLPKGAGTRLAAVWLIFISSAAILVPFLPIDPVSIDLPLRLVPPLSGLSEGPEYLLGADPLGRPLLIRILYGARISLTVGLLASALATVIGVGLGITAALKRGLYEDLVMRVIDLWMTLPVLLVALVVLYVTGPGVSKVILILGLMRWVVFARIARALTLSLMERPFFEAAQVAGSSTWGILRRHVLRNIKWDILVVATLEIARAMITEAALSFLGLGVQPPQASWGTLLADGREYLGSAAWLVALPGLAILLTTLATNMFVHGFRTSSPGQIHLPQK